MSGVKMKLEQNQPGLVSGSGVRLILDGVVQQGVAQMSLELRPNDVPRLHVEYLVELETQELEGELEGVRTLVITEPTTRRIFRVVQHDGDKLSSTVLRLYDQLNHNGL